MILASGWDHSFRDSSARFILPNAWAELPQAFHKGHDMLHLSLVHIDLSSLTGILHHIIVLAGSILGGSSSG